MKEQLYNDFITKVLPKVQEGLIISQEYFTDLFGRYIKYLIIKDSFGLFLSVIGFTLGVTLLYKFLKEEYDDYEIPWKAILGTFFTIVGFLSTLGFFLALAKDIYIPEVRVYESLISRRQ